MSDRTRVLALQIAVILAVCAFLFFFGLGAFGLAGADEPRYAQIAREMSERHDWAARVPAAAHAVVLVLAVFFFMGRFRPGSEFDSAIITASCPGIFVFAR